MAPREKPEPDPYLDVEAWERWPAGACGVDEPPRLFRIFQQYAQTKPRSLRCALARSMGLKGKTARAVRVSGGLYRASIRWRWRERADDWEKHLAEKEHVAFEAARRKARARRIAQLIALGDKFDAGLARLDLKQMQPNEFVRELVRTHAAEQAELKDRPEDRAGEEKPDAGLPRLEDILKPPEATDHKPDPDLKGEPHAENS
jgi:hypothetical protein